MRAVKLQVLSNANTAPEIAKSTPDNLPKLTDVCLPKDLPFCSFFSPKSLFNWVHSKNDTFFVCIKHIKAGNLRAIYLSDQGESKRRMSADIMYIIVVQRALGI